MSRWLKSVNNLLENLDGTAENVAENVAEVAAGAASGVDVGQLLESSRQAVGLPSRGGLSDDDDDDENDYTDEEEEDYYDDEAFGSDEYVEDENITNDVNENKNAAAEDDYEEVLEEITDGEEAIVDDSDHNGSSTMNDYESEIAGLTGSAQIRLDTLQETNDTSETERNNPEDSISIEGRRSVTTVSELSFSEADMGGNDDDAKAVSGAAPRGRSPKPPTTRRGGKRPSPVPPTGAIESKHETDESQKQTESKPSNENAKLPKDQAGREFTETPKVAAQQDLKSSQVRKHPGTDSTRQPTPISAPLPQLKAIPKQKEIVPTTTAASTSAANNASTVALNKKIQSLQAQLSKSQKELSAAQNQNTKLTQQLEASEAEVEAQAKELERAGNELATNRTKAQEDQDDLLDEHEEELEELEKKHQQEVKSMREEYEKTIAEWKEQYELEQAKRQHESGDWTKELEESVQREKDALKRLHEVTGEKTALQSKLDKVTIHDSSLQEQLEAALLSSKTASEREQKAQAELAAATEQHSRQIAQRHRREAELEQTIAELGSALTLARQQDQTRQQTSTNQHGSEVSLIELKEQHNAEVTRLKERSDLLSEELETIQVSFALETQRREALQQELSDVGRERDEEISHSQTRQQQYDVKVADLEATVARLQSSLRSSNQTQSQNILTGSNHSQNNGDNDGTGRGQQMKIKLDESKREIAKLSEQLLRHQDMVESSKTEILALKGRLQAATTRAEDAEKALYSNTSTTSNNNGSGDIESATSTKRPQAFSMRRRIKGGGRAGIASSRPGSVRSIRSALQLGPGRAVTNPAMDQIAQTIDSIDSWMIETGSVLRYEPLARLGFFVYLTILHLWAFALVVFHTTEVPHGDFGSMDSNPTHWRKHS